MAPRTAEELGRVLGDVRSASSLAGALGRTGAENRLAKRERRLSRKITKRGGDPTTFEGTDFSEGTFSLTEAGQLRRTLSRRRQDGQTTFARPSAFNERLRGLDAERRLEESEAFLENEINPQFEAARARLTKRLDSDVITATEVARQRTQIGDTVRSASTGRLRRVAAILGLRGISPDSPAGQALVNRNAQAADDQVLELMRKLGIDVARINREDEGRNIQLASQLGSQQIAARNAALTGDINRVQEVQSSLSELFEAIQQSRELADLQEGMLEDTLRAERTNTLINAGVQIGGAVAAAA